MLTSWIVFAEALFFVYVSYLFGDIAFRFTKTQLTRALEERVYRVILGYGLFGFCSFIFASFGFLSTNVLWALVSLIICTSYKTISAHLKFLFQNSPRLLWEKIKKIFRENTFLKIIIVLWIFTNLLIVFVPITGHDSLDYHLPIIRDIANTKTLTFTQSIDEYQYLPVLGEIIYATPFILFNETHDPYVFQVIQFSLLILFIFLIFDFAKKRTKTKFLPFVAAFGAMAVMDFEREVMHGGYVDILAFLFSISSLFLVIEYAAEEKIKPKILALSALLVGLGAGIKYTSLFFFGFNGLILLYSLFKHKIKLTRSVTLLLFYSIIFSITISPWYLKNYVEFGNPVYPMFSDSQFTSSVGLFVRERTLPNLIVFPFYKFSQWFFHDKESSSQLILLGYFGILYLLVLYSIIKRKKWTVPETLLFLFIESYFSFVFFVSHQNRFMIPSLILIPTLIIFFIDQFFMGDEKTRKTPWLQGRFAYTLLCIGFVIIFLGNLHYFYVRWKYFFHIDTEKAYKIEIGGM